MQAVTAVLEDPTGVNPIAFLPDAKEGMKQFYRPLVAKATPSSASGAATACVVNGAFNKSMLSTKDKMAYADRGDGSELSAAVQMHLKAAAAAATAAAGPPRMLLSIIQNIARFVNSKHMKSQVCLHC